MSSLVSTALADFDQELNSTRRMLERVPADKLDYRPHDKSFTLGRLARHLTDLPRLAAAILTTTDFKFDAPAGGSSKEPATSDEFLALWDERVAALKPLLEKATDDELKVVWTASSHGHVVMQLPRIAALRGVVINHMIHHRGQLSVYYRLAGVPVPGLYGPSADEPR